ncbi:DUF2341 domain-containing protein [bacterium]|nr:MAG: DUF2341 domain-containing protein [bacterium]
MANKKKNNQHEYVNSVDGLRRAEPVLRVESSSVVEVDEVTRLELIGKWLRKTVPSIILQLKSIALQLKSIVSTVRLHILEIFTRITARIPRVRLPRFAVSNRVRSVVASTSLVFMVLLMFFNLGIGNIAQAFDTFSQSDWSGGVGASPVNQYSEKDNVVTTTPNRIDIDSQQNTNWCATANCNNQWQYRKKVILSDYSGNIVAQSSLQYEVTLDYTANMKSDFSDIRFVNELGGADIPFTLIYKTDSQSAKYIVKISVSGGVADKELYVYYGNSSAVGFDNRTGTMDWADDFRSGTCAKILNCSQVGLVVGNGELSSIQDHQSIEAALSGKTFDRAINRVFEYDFQYDFSSLTDCSDGGYSMASNFGGNTYDKYSNLGTYIRRGSCDRDVFGSFNYVSMRDDSIGYENGGWLENWDNPSPKASFNSLEWARLRMVSYPGSGMDFFLSKDNGKTFNKINIAPYSSSNLTFDIHRFELYTSSNASSLSLKIRNMQAYSIPSLAAPPVYLGVEEKLGGYTGVIASAEIDLSASGAYFGAITASTVGSGKVSFLISGSATAGGTKTFAEAGSCGWINNGALASASKCLEPNTRYVKYFAVLQDDDGVRDLSVTNIGLEYGMDNTDPNGATNIIAKRDSVLGAQITTGWINTIPYFSWSTATDNPGGSGIGGYCVYFGTDQTADMATTSGLLPSSGPVNTNGLCHYATADASLSLSDINLQGSLDSGQTYYFKIRSFDQSGNMSGEEVYQLGYDTEEPEFNTLATGPNGAVNSPLANINWLTTPPASADDSGGSGIAGVRYCVNYFGSVLPECNIETGGGEDTPDWIWFGASGNPGGLYDLSDTIPFTDGGFQISTNALSHLTNEGINYAYVVLLDRAGNVGGGGVGYINTTQQTASPPRNLVVSPPISSQNQFSFSWEAPSSLTGPASEVDYCWTVNAPILQDASNCNWTGKGITQLANGAYATQQGENTMYVMAKDQSQNFSNMNVATVKFTAFTTAPGAPQNLELSDVSTRATASWKIALSWSAPQLPGSGVTGYKIYRSTNNVDFTEVGTTSNTNLSFIDSGLSQTDYYYYVKACDSANSCGVASNTEIEYPSGRYTTPARLTDDTDQPKIRDIGTRKATVYWFTDRASDSKIAYGTAPGQYFPEEVGNSAQISTHVVNLTNLEPGKTYYYVARWTDEDGNMGVSTERSFTTLPAPTVKEVSASNLTIGSAVVNFTTDNAHKANVYFGANDAFGGVKSVNTSTSSSSYSLSLDNLRDGQKYYFKISTVDADGYEYQGDIYSFTTPARPRIINLRFDTVEGEPSSTQKIVWTTNVPTTSEVVYGLRDGKQIEAVDSVLVVEHEMVVRGLEDDADYQLVARSRDAAGNLAISDRQSFQTAEDTRAPKISNLKIETDIRGSGGEARGQVIVSWRTDEPATSQVAFAKGRTDELSNRSQQDTRLTTEHVVVVSDLTTSSIYQVQAVSSDKAGNESSSDAQTAIIGRGTDSIFSVIFNALQAIFGFGDSSI